MMPVDPDLPIPGGFRKGDIVQVTIDPATVSKVVNGATGRVLARPSGGGPHRPVETKLVTISRCNVDGRLLGTDKTSLLPENLELIRRRGKALSCPCCGKASLTLFGRWPPTAIHPRHRVSPAACGACAYRSAAVGAILRGDGP